MLIIYPSYSPIVQWSSIRAFGAWDPGSNPGGAIKTISKADCSFNNLSGIRTAGIESRAKGLLVNEYKIRKYFCELVEKLAF